MAITLAEAQAQLLTVNSAIETYIKGERLSELRVGSGSFQRTYKYQELSIDFLRQLQAELMATIDTLSPVTPTFRTNAHIPLVVGKGIY